MYKHIEKPKQKIHFKQNSIILLNSKHKETKIHYTELAY